MQKMLIVGIVCSFWASVVSAQAPPPPSAKPAPKAKTAPVAQSPESIECSKQADAKGLHGPERIKFRANCKNKLMKAKKS